MLSPNSLPLFGTQCYSFASYLVTYIIHFLYENSTKNLKFYHIEF
nr:MAG TPA: hypothetical protein [Caudoviricetes sp.]